MNRGFINKNKKPIILIIDHDTITSREIKEQLTDNLYETEFLYDSTFVFDQIRNINPDLILLQKDMPDINGFEICQFLKSIPILGEIPVIMILNSKNDEEITKSFESGATDYIIKPVNKIELNIRIKNHIDHTESKNNERELSSYLIEIKSKMQHFSEVVPTCSYCNKIRDDENHWLDIEKYLIENFDIKFSHGICPDCLDTNYPELSDKIASEKESI